MGVKVILPSLSKKASAAAARSTYDHSFAVRAGRLWNVLPRIVNTQKTLASFKIYLGNFLDILPDKPPSPGYSAENSNSIIEAGAVKEVVRRLRDGLNKQLTAGDGVILIFGTKFN